MKKRKGIYRGKTTKGFGRIYVEDKRDFPAREMLRMQSARTSRYWYDRSFRGNQGDTPKCVAYTMAHLLHASPVTYGAAGAPVVHPDIIYPLAQQFDEWEGEAYDGSSGRGGMKALLHLGYITEFRRCETVNEIVYALLEHGTVAVGTWWHSFMQYPVNGVIGAGEPDYLGGHEYLLTGINLNKGKHGRVRVLNSHGFDYGIGGVAEFELDVFESVFSEEGDAYIATEKVAR